MLELLAPTDPIRPAQSVYPGQAVSRPEQGNAGRARRPALPLRQRAQAPVLRLFSAKRRAVGPHAKLPQRSSSARTRYATVASVRAETEPHAWSINRSFETERTASQSAHDVSRSPPSGGSMRTRSGIRARSVVVSGMTITRPAGPLLNWSFEMMSAGRWRPCSWPRTGSKSVSQISPRFGNYQSMPSASDPSSSSSSSTVSPLSRSAA
jgi:hypothetical protein